ncbi:MAG: hypothetical protein P8Y93_05380 [Acidobacteriota bacterium]
MFDDTNWRLAPHFAPLAAQLLEDCRVITTSAALEDLARSLSGQIAGSD